MWLAVADSTTQIGVADHAKYVDTSSQLGAASVPDSVVCLIFASARWKQKIKRNTHHTGLVRPLVIDIMAISWLSLKNYL